MPRKRSIDDNELIEAVKEAKNFEELYHLLGKQYFYYRSINSRIEELGLDTSHFIGKSLFTEEEFLKAAKSAKSVRHLAKKLGLSGRTSRLYYFIKKYKIKFST